MGNIYTKYPQKNEGVKPAIGKLGVLVGLSFNDAPDLFFMTNNTRDEFFDCYQRVHSIDDVYVARTFCMDELFNAVKEKPELTCAYDMKIIATISEADILLKTDLAESIGVVLFLYEGDPDKTRVTLIDYAEWTTMVLMMENSSPN